jgi:hypothetical protein
LGSVLFSVIFGFEPFCRRFLTLFFEVRVGFACVLGASFLKSATRERGGRRFSISGANERAQETGGGKTRKKKRSPE